MPGPLGVDSSFRAINAEDPGSAEHPGSMCSFQNKRKFRCVAAAERAAPAVARFAVISSLLRTLRAPAAPSGGTAVPYVYSSGCYHPRNCRHIAGTPGLLGGEGVVVGGAGHVDRGGDAVRRQVRARGVAIDG